MSTLEVIENPFTDKELQEVFIKQCNKQPFEIAKTVAKDKQKVKISLRGDNIDERYFDIWNDDYIVYFNRVVKGRDGFGYARNRFDDYNDFEKEIHDGLRLRKDAQLSLF